MVLREVEHVAHAPESVLHVVLKTYL